MGESGHCSNGCGRLQFRHYKTCCTHCKGPDGPHAADCARKAAAECEDEEEDAEFHGIDFASLDDVSTTKRSAGLRAAEADEVLGLLIEIGIPAHAAKNYLQGFVKHGFDSIKAVRTLQPKDMDLLEVKEGHRRLILQLSSASGVKSGDTLSGKVSAAGGSSIGEHSGADSKAGRKKTKATENISDDATDSTLHRSKKAKASSSTAGSTSGGGLPLDGLVLCVSGTMSMIRRQFHDMLQEQGARVVPSVTGTTTHLVTTASEADCPTRKVLAAMDKGVPCVSEDFIHESVANGSTVDQTDYLLVQTDSTRSSSWPSGSRSGRGGTGGAPEAKACPVTKHRHVECEGRVTGKASGERASELDTIMVARAKAPAVTVTIDKASEAAARKVMLAQKWTDKHDPTGWWISEKLDGVRAYWDGRNFYSRLGNPFPAPEWFKKGLPPSPLDGELWCGRRQFRRCLSIVRNRASGDLWQFITYLVFDAPSVNKPYEERVAHIKKLVVPGKKPVPGAPSHGSSAKGSGCPYAAPVGIIACEGRDHLKRELAKVDSKGGEGLMLREPKSKYENKRSNVLRKVKSVHDEEAKIVGHEGGKGRAFRLGALVLKTPDGREFTCGSGLSAEDRRSPPEIGSIVTYRFTELMDNGYPRFPVYVGPRIDVDWADLCTKYAPPSTSRGELRRDHSILYAGDALSRTLTMRAESLPAPGPADAEVLASGASEGGDTEDECSDHTGEPASSRSAPAHPTIDSRTGIDRSRSQLLADEAGLDLETARSLLHEHDRAAARV